MSVRLGYAVCLRATLRTHAQLAYPLLRGHHGEYARRITSVQTGGKGRVGSAQVLSSTLPFPAPACGSNSGAMEAPIVFVRGKRPARERQPCLLDTLALGALHMASTKLHKKAVIALTRWRVWDPPTTSWVTKPEVRLQMFAADEAVSYRDTRIYHQGRLMDWKDYAEPRKQ